MGGRGEAAQVGISPILGGWSAETGQAAKNAVQSWRLIKKGDAFVFEPAVVRVPGLRLIHNFGLHHGFRREQSEQSELREATEEEPGVGWQSGEPACG